MASPTPTPSPRPVARRQINASLRLVAFALALTACSEQIPDDEGLCDGDACDDDAPKPDDDATTPDDDAPSPAFDVIRDAGSDARPDASTADRPLDVPTLDVPTLDVPLAVDLPVPVDLSLPVDVPARVDVGRDVPSPVDVPPPVDVPASGGCVSGASGTHVARFRWTGSGARASVSYEANTLPDRSHWRVTANSRSIGYTPVFSDTGLGEGGLDLSGTTFIDVELSTVGLTSITGASLAIYGRSFNTGASGSFAWQTFAGTGASPSGNVANSAPYRWYRADATSAFDSGNGGILLRITPGPPSGALIVNRVEICFNAR